MKKETITKQSDRLKSYANAAAEELLTQAAARESLYLPADTVRVREKELDSLGQALSRADADNEFVAVRNTQDETSRLRLSALQLQALLLQQMERAFRHRHTSSVREAGHAAARLQVMGGSNGLFEHLLTVVTNVEQQAGTFE